MKYFTTMVLFTIIGCVPMNTKHNTNAEWETQPSKLLHEVMKTGCDPKEIKVSKSIREEALIVRCKE